MLSWQGTASLLTALKLPRLWWRAAVSHSIARQVLAKPTVCRPNQCPCPQEEFLLEYGRGYWNNMRKERERCRLNEVRGIACSVLHTALPHCHASSRSDPTVRPRADTIPAPPRHAFLPALTCLLASCLRLP